jgi:hypothetical protein
VDCQIKDAEISALAIGLKKLQKLSVGINRIGSVGAKAISDCLDNLT